MRAKTRHPGRSKLQRRGEFCAPPVPLFCAQVWRSVQPIRAICLSINRMGMNLGSDLFRTRFPFFTVFLSLKSIAIRRKGTLGTANSFFCYFTVYSCTRGIVRRAIPAPRHCKVVTLHSLLATLVATRKKTNGQVSAQTRYCLFIRVVFGKMI